MNKVVRTLLVFCVALVLTSCGTGGENGSAVNSPTLSNTNPTVNDATPLNNIANPPAEIKAFPIYYNEDKGAYYNAVTGNLITDEEAIQNPISTTDNPDYNQSRVHIWRTMTPVWNSRHGWHWWYFAYDTGHPFPQVWQFHNRPHVNFCKYQTWNNMWDDINNRSNARAFYDGHFTVYRSGGSVCAIYYVSKDSDGGGTGTKRDQCVDGNKVKNAAWLSAFAVSAMGIYNGISGAVQPAFQLLGGVI